MKKKNNKITIIDSILAVICIVISMEAITPTAASNNSQFFYWLIILVLFFIPYTLVSTELGTTYPSEYGLYAWVKKALGRNNGVRSAWYYWVNFPLWMLSFAILFGELANILFDGNLSTLTLIIIETSFLAVTCYFGTKRANMLDDIMDVGAIFKLILLGGIIFLGVYSFFNFGSATDFSISTFKPDFSFVSLSVIGLLLFNFTGLEIVTTFTKDMKNVKKQLPKTLLFSSILIIVFYIIPIICMKIITPSSSLSASTGLIDSYRLAFENIGFHNMVSTAIIFILILMFMYILVAIIISWTFGINSVVRKVALDEGLPKYISHVNKDNVPDNVSFINFIIACGLGLLVKIVPGIGENVFMTVFSTSVIVYLCSYLFLFISFYKLRKTDSKERVYKVPGNDLFLKLICVIPTLILIIGIFFLLVPELHSDITKYQWPIIITFISIILIGELFVKFWRKI